MDGETSELSQSDTSISDVSISKTPVSLLQELCLRKGLIPRYELIQIMGVVHDPTFKYKVNVGDLVAVGSGRTKQMAKHEAASAMLDNLKQLSSGPLASSSEIVSKVVAEVTSSMDGFHISAPAKNEIAGNPIGDLQALCLTLEIPTPTYTTTKEEGPSHDRFFEILCSLNEHLAETGAGKTKKQAKKEAAHKLFSIVKSMPPELLKESFVMVDRNGTVNKCSSMQANEPHPVQQLQHFLGGLKRGPQLESLQDLQLFQKNFEFRPEQLLHEIEVEQNFCVSYVHVDEKSKDGKCLCFVQLGTSPVVVCLGSADVPEMAQRESCRNALEYLRVMTKS